MKRSALILALLIVAATVVPAQIRVNTSHSGPVRALAHDPRTGFLFTAGDDGKVIVWDPALSELKQTIQISHLSIQRLAVHPHQGQMAVVVSDSRRQFSLEVWDWEQGRRLFTQTLGELPIFIEYSPKGTFLVYAQNDFNSMRFLASATGRSLPYLRRGFGIVTFATVASSEERIMTYTPSDGSIVYWDIASGRQVQTATTEQNIDDLAVLTNRRFAAGSRDNELVVVDIVDGTIRDRFPMSNIEQVLVDRSSGEIAVLSRTGRQSEVRFFTFERNRLSRSTRIPPSLPAALTGLTFQENSLFAGSNDGSLYQFGADSRLGRTIAQNQVQPITGFAYTEGAIHLATEQQILSLDSDLFGPSDIPVNRVERLEVTTHANPFSAAARLSTVNRTQSIDPSIVLWDTTGRDPVLTSYRPATSGFTVLPLDEHRPARQVKSDDGKLLVLHDQSSLRLIDLETYAATFTYSSEGMESVVSVESTIVIGKTRANPFDSSLMRVDTRTGETVRIQNDNFLVFDIVYDQARGLLYTLGLQQVGNAVRTAVTLHRGTNFENRRVIATYDGEDLDARITFDPSTGKVYTSLGMEGVRVWDGRRTIQLTGAGRVARALFVANRHLLAVNRDGTMDVWNLNNGERIFTVYLFRDAHWAVITNDGYYVVSHPDAERHLSFVPESGRGVRRSTLQDYRLRLPQNRRGG